ncbi:aspartyl-phosphate phosphatase Spo0E family protein [Salipaludibacillus sp. CF4.18]|uniref:aspartyl-phosphate phosphatase Spo0E family protein n=1 Tax=Salipaludibacillus sp. CF4.18 TaxID=3373081 RepID=UPI003EE5294B
MATQEKPLDKLEYKIKLLRSLMINTGHLRGLTHPHTIKNSQKLDIYLNKYGKIRSLG